MRVRPSVCALLLMAPGAAMADCPSAPDMDRAGIWVTTDDGTVTHYTKQPGDLIAETSLFDDGSGVWIVSYRGVYVIEDGGVADGERIPQTRVAYTLSRPLSELPPVAPGVAWSGVVAARPSDPDAAERTADKEVTFFFGPRAPLALGDCAYDSILARVYYMEADGGGEYYDFRYVPEFGVALLAASGGVGRPADVVYEPLAVSASEP